MRAASAWWSWRDRARSFPHARGKLKRSWPFTPNPTACDSAAGSCWSSWRHPWTSRPRRRCELTWSNTARAPTDSARGPRRWRRRRKSTTNSTCATTRSASFSTRDRKSTRLNSSHLVISYAVFCLKKKRKTALYSRLLLPSPDENIVHDRTSAYSHSPSHLYLTSLFQIDAYIHCDRRSLRR